MNGLTEIVAMNRRTKRGARVQPRCSFLRSTLGGITLYDEPTKRTAYIRDAGACEEFVAKHRKLKTVNARDKFILAQFP